MKKLLLTWVIVFLTIGLGWAQTNNTRIQNFRPKKDCYFAIFALDAPTTVQTWEKPSIQIVYTLPTETATNYQIEMKFYEEERVMIFELPNQDKDVLIDTKMIG